MNTKTPANVLVVDDQRPVRDLLARWLTAEGHSCLEAESAEAAWERLQQREFHLVTLDVRMPGRSGVELLDAIAEHYPDTAVLMVTASDETHAAIDALTRGACAYLLKPIQREELLFHVRRALERRHFMIDKREYTRDLEEKVRQQTRQIRRTQEEIIHRLVSASMYRDEETWMHIRRTGLLSEALARAAGWSAGEAENLRMAAPMHDVGKIGVPDAILRKPGKLTPDEFEVIKTHTTIGARMLAGSDTPILQMAAEIALSHHERWDGGGYPNGLAGHAIPESARIVAIVDVYDALSHDRVYRPAFAEDEVLTIMQQGAGSQFDPLLLGCFFSRFADLREIARQHPDEADKPGLIQPSGLSTAEAIPQGVPAG